MYCSTGGMELMQQLKDGETDKPPSLRKKICDFTVIGQVILIGFLSLSLYDVIREQSDFATLQVNTSSLNETERIPYLVRDSDIHIHSDICFTSSCFSCNQQICSLCSQCLTYQQRNILKDVIWEHLKRAGNRLAFSIVKEETETTENLSDENELISNWMRNKCKRDDYWCIT